jgi:hypothetical protein
MEMETEMEMISKGTVTATNVNVEGLIISYGVADERQRAVGQ